MLYAALPWIQITVSLMIPDTCSLISSTCCAGCRQMGEWSCEKPSEPVLLLGLTRWGWLDLNLLPAVPSSHAATAAAAVCRRLFSPLHLTLIGKQILDVLLLERAGGAAGCTHVQVGGQLAPFLVLVYLDGWGLGEWQDISQMRITGNALMSFLSLWSSVY